MPSFLKNHPTLTILQVCILIGILFLWLWQQYFLIWIIVVADAVGMFTFLRYHFPDSHATLETLKEAWSTATEWADRQIQSFLALVHRQTDAFLGRYYTWLLTTYGHINTFGLYHRKDDHDNHHNGHTENTENNQCQATIPIWDIFINVGIARGLSASLGRSQRNLGLYGTAGVADADIWHFLRERSLRKTTSHDTLVVIGNTGCGKTTLMYYLALAFCTHVYHRYRVKPYIPMLLPLREHVDRIVNNPHASLATLLQEYFGSEAPEDRRLNPPDGWFEQQLSQKRCIVLFDGLGGIQQDKRRIVTYWIDRQIAVYPRAQFVLTSREGSYHEAPLADDTPCSIVEICSFTPEQRKAFLEKWYEATQSAQATQSTQSANGSSQDTSKAKAQHIITAIEKRSTLRKLAGNPFLLTMIALDQAEESGNPLQDLPHSRLELYHSIYEKLLNRPMYKAEKAGINAGAEEGRGDPTLKDQLLRSIALAMMNDKRVDITTTEAGTLFEQHIQESQGSDELHNSLRTDDPAAILSYLSTSTNLIMPIEGDRWIFVHSSFREYIAALALSSQQTEPNWRDMVTKTWWYETLAFCAAMRDATPIVQACLEEDTVDSIALALHCAEVKHSLNPAIEQQVNDVLVRDLEHPSDLTRQRLAAHMRLTRRLEEQKNRVDPTFITCAEYQLFLDDMRSQNHYLQPDHWPDYHFPLEEVRAPVMGLRAQDANSYCEWLTKRYGGGFTYRLPTMEEAKTVAAAEAEEALLATWCREDAGNELFILAGLSSKQQEDLLSRLEEIRVSQELEVPLPRGRVFNLDLSLSTMLNLDRGLAYDLNDSIATVLALDAGQNVTTQTHGHDHDLALAVSIALDFDRVLDCTVDLDLDLNRALALDLVIALDFNRTIALDFALAIDRQKERASVDMFNYEQARMLLDYMDAEGEFLKHRRIRLLKAVLDVLIAGKGDVRDVRGAWRRYAALLLEYAWIGYDQAKYHSPSWLERLIPPPPHKRHRLKARQMLLDSCWWLYIVMAREAGTLPPWEGVRVVRDDRATDAAEVF
jgi:hypothetical protein